MSKHPGGSAESIAAHIQKLIVDDNLTAAQAVAIAAPAPPLPTSTRRPGRVDTIEISGVRGFGPPQTLRLSTGLTILHAANGVGKTSFCDALELVTLGATSTSAQHPDASAETRDSVIIPHRNQAGAIPFPPRVLVRWGVVDATGSSWTGTFGRPADDPPPIAVLPRRRLRDVIGAKQTERLERLGTSLGLSEAVATWQQAAKLVRGLAAIPEAPNQDVAALARAVQDAPTPWHHRERAAVSAAVRAAARDRVSAAPERPDRVPPRVSAPVPLAALHDARTALDHLESSGDDVDSPDGQELPVALIEALDGAVEHSPVGGVCPLCDDGRLTAERVSELREMIMRAQARVERESRRGDLAEALLRLVAESEPWIPPAHSAHQAPDGPEREWGDTLEALQRLVERRRATVATIRLDDTVDLRTILGQLSALDTDIATHARRLSEARDAALERAARARERSEIRASEVDGLLAAAVDHVIAVARADALRGQLAEAATELGAHARRVVDDRIAGLAGPINAWLRVLRPAGTPEITVECTRTSGRPGIRFKIADSSPDGQPRPDALGRFSDSQLDMLGLAVQMARLDREMPGSALVLDDPTDMLDADTLAQFARGGIPRMLAGGDDAPPRQVVVVTHCRSFVQQLWSVSAEHRTMHTVQDYIEQQVDADDRFAVFSPRTSLGIFTKADSFYRENVERASGLLWFRSAFGNQVRGVLEMCAAELVTVLGVDHEKRFTAQSITLAQKMAELSREFGERVAVVDRCGSRAEHGPGEPDRRLLAGILTHWGSYWLNQSSHADVVLPGMEHIREFHVQIGRLARALSGDERVARDEWATSSRMALALRTCPRCPPS
ncbi:ATP-binding protein [Cellulomonas triticagri]|uniref:ATP-binding protein n=1 Tax=Cellulomonas triticagri TaxID=2483352 RepID=UPI001315340B|nr:ATP-binding protein [Cellulomonas triticagri]